MGKLLLMNISRPFFVATRILGVSHEDVAIRLFVETLTENAVDWFYHLDDGSITN